MSAKVTEICGVCDDKWFVMTVTRKIKSYRANGESFYAPRSSYAGPRCEEKVISGKTKYWNATIGTAKLEIWNSENAGSGELVETYRTLERGGPADAAFHYDTASAAGKVTSMNDMMFPFMIRGGEYYLSFHQGGKYKSSPGTTMANGNRPGIGISQSGHAAMDRRTGVLFHLGSRLRWIVGCCLLIKEGDSISGVDMTFNFANSFEVTNRFISMARDFANSDGGTHGERVPRSKVIFRSDYEE